MRKQSALIVPLQFFRGQPAHPLNETAFDLSAIDPFVDRLAGVMQDVHTQHSVHPGETVHLNFCHRRPASEVMEGMAASGSSVPMNAGCAIKARCGKAHPVEVSLAHDLGERKPKPRKWP